MSKFLKRIFFGIQNNQVSNPATTSVISLSVGKKLPMNLPVNTEGGCSLSCRFGLPTIVISLPNLEIDEIHALENVCLAKGIYCKPDFPSGVLTFIFFV